MLKYGFGTIQFVVAALVLAGACARAPQRMSKGRSVADEYATNDPEIERNKSNIDGSGGGNMLTCAGNIGRTYKGFGGFELTAGRQEQIPSQGDRARIKPFSALKGEFSRVLSVTPRSLLSNGDSFDEPDARLYIEPTVTGVNVFTLYRAAYEAALTYVAQNPDNLPGLGSAPSEATAGTVCTFIGTRAWHRNPSESELAACKKVALVDTVMEQSSANRWAYSIASILTAVGFASY